MVELNGIQYEVKRAKFRQFLFLQTLQEKIQQTEDLLEQGKLICQYIGTGLGIDPDTLSDLPWKPVAIAYVQILTANLIDFKLPFLKPSNLPKKYEPLPWEYPGREWYAYAHLLAKEYGWSLESIADLDVEDALKMIQEILVDQQLVREWQWNLSEKSTGYDPSTKQSKHVDLPRPEWMVIVPPPPKKIKIERSLLPMGLVIGLDGKRVEYN